MNTAFNSSALFLASMLIISACTPQDKAVTDPKTRAKILGQDQSQAPQQVELNIDQYQTVAVLLNKQAEAMEVIKLATAKSSNNLYKLTDSDKPELSFYLTADKVFMTYVRDTQEYKSTISKKWEIKVNKDGDHVVSLIAKAEKAYTKTDRSTSKDKKTYLNMNEPETTVEMKALENSSNLYQVTVSSAGYFNGSFENVQRKGKMKFALKFNIDGQGLTSNKVEASGLTGLVTLATDKNELVSATAISSENQTVVIDGSCNFVSGKVALTFLNKTLNLSENEISDEKAGFKMTLDQCQRRPTLDFSYLLKW